MQVDIQGKPAFTHLQVALNPGETLLTEANAMASMDAGLDLRATLPGGILGALSRKFLTKESFFINQIINTRDATQRVIITKATPGDILCLELNNQSFFLQPGAFVACTPAITLSTQWAGLASFINREGLFRQQVKGTGRVWIGAYGALIDKEIDGEFIVDTAHLVAYEPGIELHLQFAGGVFSSFFGGEGLVTRLSGKGRIILQSRSIPGLAGWLNPRL